MNFVLCKFLIRQVVIQSSTSLESKHIYEFPNGNKNRLLYDCSIQVMFIGPSPKKTIKLQEIFGHSNKFEYFTMRWGIPKTAVTFLCSQKLSVIPSQYFAIVFNDKLTSFILCDDTAKFSIPFQTNVSLVIKFSRFRKKTGEFATFSNETIVILTRGILFNFVQDEICSILNIQPETFSY